MLTMFQTIISLQLGLSRKIYFEQIWNNLHLESVITAKTFHPIGEVTTLIPIMDTHYIYHIDIMCDILFH